MNQLITIEDSIALAMPEAKRVNIAGNLEAEKNYAIQHLYKNEFSVNVAQKNPISVQNAVINLSAIGISLNPVLKHAYLVPRDGMICLDVSYMGLMHLAQEIGSIEWGQARIVYKNDFYENQGLNKQPEHKFNSFGDRGEKIGAYCCVKLPSGDFLTEEMSAQQINEVRNTSKAKDSKYSPWVTFEEEMWRKTVVKRASKYWPKSSDRLDKAVHVINEHEGIEDNTAEKAELVKKLHLYASDEHTPIELFGFLENIRGKDEDLHMWLCGQFEKGKKTAGKDKIAAGRNMLFDYKNIFENGDESEIQEAKEELTDLELKILGKICDIKE